MWRSQAEQITAVASSKRIKKCVKQKEIAKSGVVKLNQKPWRCSVLSKGKQDCLKRMPKEIAKNG